MADVWGQKFDKRKWLNVSGVTGQENPPTRTCKSPRRNEHMWKDRNRPSYNRLDSTGENSASSSEDLSCGFSPKIQGSYRCRPKFRESSPFTETPQFQGGGLLDKVRSVIDTCRNQYLPPQSQRNTTRNLTHRTPSNNQDSRLANLDSVAEKFTNMSMANMNPQHWSNPVPNWQQQRHTNGCGGPAHHGAHGQWGRTTNVSHDRNHTQIFHPYQEFCQPPLLSSIQNYQRNCPQPWQHMMGGNHPCYPPFNRGFNHFTQPWQHQQRSHPPYPWQWIGPQMMQACGNQGPMTRQHQQRARSPAKKQRWNRHGNQKRTCPQSKSGCHTDKNKTSSNQTSLQAPSDIKTSVDQPVQVAEVKDDGLLSKEVILVDTGKDGDQVHVHVQEVGDSAIVESVRTEKDKEQITVQGENLECQTSHTCKPEVSKVHDTGTCTCNKTESEALQRHSSIDLILSDYEVQSSTRVEVTALSPSSDLEDSDGDSDSAVETNADLWESFTATDDPYNPLCGWRCSVGIQEACPGVMSSVRDCHVDSGTDEGDNWSETDSDDDYDSGDDLPDDDVDTSLPRSLRLSDPQLKELRENLSSTPKEKSDQASLHHPSVAFVLGATSTSSEEDDDDDDWDTLDDPSSLKDDPLWDSFNRARDPYSPMEAWKCQASNLSSTLTPPSPSQTTPIRKQDSVEGLRTILLASTEREATLPQRCEKPRDSDGEGFAIATVRVYAARDDIDLGSPNVTGAAMKRVASASCLRRVQLTPQNKANKKVRFCPYSSFIILVEKDAPSCENNPGQAAENDWQACARDRMRFKARIDQLSLVLNPVLTNAHRERIYASRMASKECR